MKTVLLASFCAMCVFFTASPLFANDNCEWVIGNFMETCEMSEPDPGLCTFLNDLAYQLCNTYGNSAKSLVFMADITGIETALIQVLALQNRVMFDITVNAGISREECHGAAENLAKYIAGKTWLSSPQRMSEL